MQVLKVQTVSISLVFFQMGRKKLCPNGGRNGKKTPKKPPKGSSDTPPSSGSSHKGTREQIGKFTAEQMQACLDEIHRYQE